MCCRTMKGNSTQKAIWAPEFKNIIFTLIGYMYVANVIDLKILDWPS